MALGELLSAALRVAAVPDEPEGLEPPVRAVAASAPPAPKSTTMTSPATTYRVLWRRGKCCVVAFIP